MTEGRRRKISKYLSKHLRHQPERLGLAVRPGGWVDVGDLLEACGRHGFHLSRAELESVVRNSEKPRFSFDETEHSIRANYGHSIPVDLDLRPDRPPARLLHGTAEHIRARIRAEGLKPMKRRYVHLYESEEEALTVGARHGMPVLLRVRAAELEARGTAFYRVGEGIWLTEYVPPEFID